MNIFTKLFKCFVIFLIIILFSCNKTSDDCDLINSPHPWIGIGFEPNIEGDLVISKVVEGSPAEVGDLQPGDTVFEIENVHLPSLNSFAKFVGELTPYAPVTVKVRRQGTVLETSLIPSLLVFENQEIYIDPVDNRECDADCRCTIKVDNRLCVILYRFVGKGPNDGYLYRIECNNLQVRPVRFLNKSVCGPFEFI